MRPARNRTPACVQTPAYDPTENSNDVMAEDCLTVNVWTPRADGRKRPVLVYIHGGAFVVGSARNTWFDGAALARRGDAVIVTVQYRLGVFGYTELSHLDSRFGGGGNAGLLDQVAALRWVNRNIAKFGGNQDNVTVFGESAGGESVRILLGHRPAQGLFHRAIIQSGILAGSLGPVSDARDTTRTVMDAVGVQSAQALQQVDALKLEKLVNDSGAFPYPHQDDYAYAESPDEIIRTGRGARVPLLIGTNLDEIRYWTAMCAAPGDDSVNTPALLRNVFGNREMMQRYFGPQADKVIATYQRDYPNPEEAVTTFLGDGDFRASSIRLAEIQGRFAPSYMYLFNYRSPVKGRTGKPYGSSHSMELPFVFGISPADAARVTGPASLWGDLQDRTMDAWLAFARTGNPSTPTLQWPQYTQFRRTTMLLDSASKLVHDPYRDQRLIWSRVPTDLFPYPIPFEV
ncbi:para-nitrobenzyl esterase [Kibdelosporangium banguiense]|uniref:Carboxylic ester hydrolase n=1 Tax=Kibdelosporangium banguiense TaxID=1365924 RepID=A0ABS4TVA1_9PSEU|nr:para-nitrobenzyl esterase [Kibdelosporangium banguiense]